MTNKEIAIKLHEFMEFVYIPKGWVVPISNVAFVPWFTESDVKFLKNKQYSDVTNKNIDKWYIKEAVEEFFNKGYANIDISKERLDYEDYNKTTSS
jgi:hypothetical protein